MKLSNKDFYFETSAVNYFADKYKWNDALATKGLQLAKGNLWYLSPITLWEILLTADEVKRETIIFYCQHLFHEKLMMSPSEIIINYINAGCPIVQEKQSFHSKLSISETWQSICVDQRKTFKYDQNALKERMKVFQKLSKQLSKIIHRVVLDITVNDEEFAIQQFVEYYYQQLSSKLVYADLDYHKVIKISILFALYIICIEADLDATPQQSFWEMNGIEDIVERLEYLLKFYDSLIIRGPLYQMAIMAFHQISLDQKSNRGLFMDCLHSLYATFADVFVTNDMHFKTLKDKKIHPNFNSIMHIQELRYTTQMKEVFKPDAG